MNSFYKDCKVLVTGGAGFIGSHLAEKLVELGAHVTILDDFSTGSLTNIAFLVDKIELIGGTITDFVTVQRATKDKHLVFHCAALTSVPGSMENPLNYYRINVQGTTNVLEAARQNHVERLIFSSSSAVYGEREGKCSEQELCTPTSVYGSTKLQGEMLCKDYFTLLGLETICLRYFNVYGPRQNPQGDYAAAIAKFRWQFQQKKPIVIFGDGSQTRDFVPVSHVVQANLNAGMLPRAKVAGEAFNIATGHSISLLQLIKTMHEQEFPDFDQDILFAPARQGDIRHIEADCTKYRTLLG